MRTALRLGGAPGWAHVGKYIPYLEHLGLAWNLQNGNVQVWKIMKKPDPLINLPVVHVTVWRPENPMIFIIFTCRTGP